MYWKEFKIILDEIPLTNVLKVIKKLIDQNFYRESC